MSATVEREKRVADTLRGRASREGRSPGVVVVDRVWRFSCSVRAAAYEIVFLALLVLVGTLKGSIIPAQIPRYVPVLEPLVERWYAFDVFHSLIFSATLALLAVVIVVCTINRVPGIWNAITHPTVTTTRQFFRTAEPAAVFRPAEPLATAAAELTDLLRSRSYRVLTERRGDEVHVYADKNRFARLGTFPFHLALILVLVGGIVGAEFGFRDPVFAVAEDATRDVGHGSSLRLRLDAFVETYNERAQPVAYRSDVVLYEGEREVRRQSITVNHPLNYGRYTFYQSGFGPAAVLRVTDPNGAVVYEDSVNFLYRSRTHPDAPGGLLELPARGVRIELLFPNLQLDAKPEVGTVKLRPGEIYAQARDWGTNQKIGQGAVIGQGDTANLGGLNVQFMRERRYTILQVAYNPGIPILFAASFLLVFGLVATFAFPHRRVRALVGETGGGTEVLLAPLAKRDWGGQRDFIHTLAAIERRFGAATPHGRATHVGS
ncbi:MAG: cytochrome c biogenesis protein ResB [Thermomicrobiales bacterium]